MTKNLFRQIAYTYSGRPWMLWLLAITQSMVALSFLFLHRHSTPIVTSIGVLSAIVALFYYGSIIYYLTHRAQLAANPAKPINFMSKQVIFWIVGITVVAIGVFVALELTVWRS